MQILKKIIIYLTDPKPTPEELKYNLRDSQGNVIFEKVTISRIERFTRDYPGQWIIEPI